MSKRSKKRQGRRVPGKGSVHAASSQAHAPSAATLYRVKLLDRASYIRLGNNIDAVSESVIWERDQAAIVMIRQASTVGALLDLAPLAMGLAEYEWDRRMRRYGPEAIAPIAARLRHTAALDDAPLRGKIIEILIAELRWRGEAGAAALQECFDTLDPYGRSLACVALGLLGAHDAAEQIWDFYTKVAYTKHETWLVGALWALTDLHDEAIPEALADLVYAQRLFPELFGFLAAFGDEQAIIPLAEFLVDKTVGDQYEALMALVGIAHRIGRALLIDELSEALTEDNLPGAAEEMADAFLSRSFEEAKEYFAIFFDEMSDGSTAQETSA